MSERARIPPTATPAMADVLRAGCDMACATASDGAALCAVVVAIVPNADEASSSTRDVELPAGVAAFNDVLDDASADGLVDRVPDLVRDERVTNNVTCCVTVLAVYRSDIRCQIQS
jgi:hypothetical protein